MVDYSMTRKQFSSGNTKMLSKCALECKSVASAVFFLLLNNVKLKHNKLCGNPAVIDSHHVIMADKTNMRLSNNIQALCYCYINHYPKLKRSKMR